MAVPDFQSLMLPVLKELGDGETYHWRDVADRVAENLGLTEEDIKEKLKSGGGRYYNRIQWTKAHFLRAGLIDSPGRALMRITNRGRALLDSSPNQLKIKDLMQFPEYATFRSGGKTKPDDGATLLLEEVSSLPEDRIDEAYTEHRAQVVSQLLIRIKENGPYFLERLVADLMPALGYGESEVTKLTGDEGIDGIVKEDLLGFESIYLQAKNWESPVGRPEIQKFLGSLVGRHARKGVFVTTSSFTKEAREFVARLEQKIILIDGKRLGEMLYDHGLGVQEKTAYEIKEVDENYFDEN